MASRINLNLIVILIVVLGGSAGLIGGFFYLRNAGDAERFEKLGDEQYAEGAFAEAASLYMSAARRDPKNELYHDKAEDALRQVVPVTSDEVRQRYGELIALLRHRANHDPGDADDHLRLLDELVHAARHSEAPVFWEEVETAAHAMWRGVAVGDPKRIEAKLYEATALLTPSQLATRSEADLEAGREALETYLAEQPDSDRAWSVRLSYEREIARIAHRSGLTTWEEDLARAQQTAREALENVEDGLHVPIAVLELVRVEQMAAGESSFSNGEIQEIASTLEERLAKLEDPFLVGRGADAIQGVRWVDEVPDALLIVDKYLERHPDAPALRFVRARFLYRLRKLDEAADDARIILETPSLPVSYEAQVLFVIRRQAAGLLSDVAFVRWAEADPERQPELLEALRERHAELDALVADKANDPILQRASAKLAIAEDDPDRAVQMFERLLAQVEEPDVETLIYASAMLEEAGSLGPALDRIEQAVALQPQNAALWIRQINLELRMRDLEKAMATATSAMQLHPDDEQLAALASEAQRQLNVQAGLGEDPIAKAVRNARGLSNRGEYEAARQSVLRMLEQSPDSLRLIHTMAVIERRAGRDEEVRRWVERGLEASPDSPIFQGMLAGLESGDDPIRRIERTIEQRHADLADRYAHLFAEFDALADLQKQVAERYESEGDAASADEARELRERARAKAEENLRLARQEDENHPVLVDRLFQNALQRGRETGEWDAAVALADRATSLNLDSANGNLFSGRLAWAQGKEQEAIALLEQVTQTIPHDATAWRALALAYLGVGRVHQAMESFEEAYRRNPTDLPTVRPYVDLLLRAGERTRALLILQKAQTVVGTDVQIREAWLTLEGEIGDKARVLRYRRDQWRVDPNDRLNAARLVAFLSQTEPDYTMILDEAGRSEYTAAAWDRLTRREQRRVLERTETQWEDEARQVLEEMAPPGERDVNWHALMADLERETGSPEKGERLLREFLNEQTDPKQRVTAAIALAQFLARIQRFADAVAALEQVRSDQSESTRSVDLALGNLYFQLNEYAQAAERFALVHEANPSNELAVRLVESHMNAGDVEQARDAFERISDDQAGARMSNTMRLLEAALLDAEADALWADGNQAEAEAKIRRFHDLLDEVIERDPTNSKPYVIRARTLVKQYQRTDDPVLIEDAIFALTRADEVRADQTETSMIRAAAYQASNDFDRAIGELRRLLERSPNLLRPRITLIQMLVQRGQLDDAVTAATAGIEDNPASALWWNYRGAIHLEQRKDPRSAAADFERAFELEPSSSNLARLLTSLMRMSPPDRQSVGRLMANHQDLIESQPQLLAMSAEAMALAGNRDGALQRLERSYSMFKEMIASQQLNERSMDSWFDSVARTFGANRLDEAEAFVLDLSNGSPTMAEHRALARMWGTNGRFERAIELQREAISRAPEEPAFLLGMLRRELAGYHAALGQWAEAAEAYEGALQALPNDVLMRNNLAFILAEELNDAASALPHAQKAAELSPNDANVIDTLGRVLYLRGDLAEAERKLRDSLQLSESATTYVHLAEVQLAQGDAGRAMRALERAEELNPDPKTQAEIARIADDIRTRGAGGR